MADRRAVRRRPRGGQPEPGRPRLLRGLDAGLHAGVAGPGGRARARRPGRRGAAARRRHRGRLHALPPRRRDARSTSCSRRGRDPSGLAGAREQSRARYPDDEGYVERDGVRLFYEVYGDGDPTILLLPTWSIIHSRHWKAQIPYLARHFRVVTFDGRGNGKSDRPRGVAAYLEAEFAADALAVMDATDTEQAVLAGLSCARAGGTLARRRPPRARAGGRSTSARPSRSRPAIPERAIAVALRGGARHRRRLGEVQPPLLAAGLPRASSSSSSRRCSTSRTRPSRSRTASAGRSRPTRRRSPTRRRRWASAAARSSRTSRPACTCPVLVIHGDQDLIRPHAQGAALAEADRRRARDAARAPATARRRATRSRSTCCCASSSSAPPAQRAWTRGRSRRKRALFVSSPIGLGHARRDVAIAQELRALHPDLEIDWLAQDPVTARARGRGRARPPRQRAARQRVRRTSSPSRPSTTCTASRRGAGWTRSWSRTSWSSTTSCASSRTTCGSATRPGSSTTSCTRTRSSSAPPTCG